MTTNRTERLLVTGRRLAIVGTTVALLLGGAVSLSAAPGKKGLGDLVCFGTAGIVCSQVHNQSKVSIRTAANWEVGGDEYSGEDLPKSKMGWLKPGQSSESGKEIDAFRAMAGCKTFYRFENGKQRYEDRRNRGSRWIRVGGNKEAFITDVRRPARPSRRPISGPHP
jgi:hypothetical protein